jgi:hypothetical protein
MGKRLEARAKWTGLASSVVGFSLCFGTIAIPPASAQAPQNTITLTLLDGSGTPMAGGDVAVYVEPFDASFPYTPVQMVSGTADANGVFTFSSSANSVAAAEGAKTSSSYINGLVIAINSARTWSINENWMFSVDPSLNVAKTFQAETAEDGSALQWNVPAATLIQADPVDYDVLPAGRTPCGTAPPQTITPSGPTARVQRSQSTTQSEASFDASGGQEAACADEMSDAGSGDGLVNRPVRVASLHVANAMQGSYFIGQGIATKAKDVFRLCTLSVGGVDGCSAASVGYWHTEKQARSSTLTMGAFTGPLDYALRMDYQFRRTIRCAKHHWTGTDAYECKKWKRAWILKQFLGGGDHVQGSTDKPTRLASNQTILGSGVTFSTAKSDGENFGAGYTLLGRTVEAETDYSSINKITFKGLSGCSSHYLFGSKNPPLYASTIWSTSLGC